MRKTQFKSNKNLALFLGLYGKKHMGLATRASRDSRAAHVHVQPIVCNKNTHAFLPNFQQIITEQAHYYSTFALRLAFFFTPANVSVDYTKNTVFCENCEKL